MPTLKAGKQSSQQGVTLMEMLVVLVLLTCMMGLAVPRMWQLLAVGPADNAANQIDALMQFGVQEARRSQQTLLLRVVFEPAELHLHKGEAVVKKVLFGDGVSIVSVLLNGKKLLKGTGNIFIRPSGVSDACSVLLGAEGVEKKVVITPFRGKVTASTVIAN